MHSGDDDSSSDDSGSDTGHETSSATTPTYAVSPGVSSPNEGKMKNTVVGGEDAGGPVTAALNLQEHQDSSWLDINQFPDSHIGFEDGAAEDECQKMGDIEGNLGSDGAKDGQAEDGPQEMGYNVDWDEDGPGNEDGVERGGEDVIADPEMDGIGVDGEGSHGKDDPMVGVGGGAEGW